MTNMLNRFKQAMEDSLTTMAAKATIGEFTQVCVESEDDEIIRIRPRSKSKVAARHSQEKWKSVNLRFVKDLGIFDFDSTPTLGGDPLNASAQRLVDELNQYYGKVLPITKRKKDTMVMRATRFVESVQFLGLNNYGLKPWEGASLRVRLCTSGMHRVESDVELYFNFVTETFSASHNGGEMDPEIVSLRCELGDRILKVYKNGVRAVQELESPPKPEAEKPGLGSVNRVYAPQPLQNVQIYGGDGTVTFASIDRDKVYVDMKIRDVVGVNFNMDEPQLTELIQSLTELRDQMRD